MVNGYVKNGEFGVAHKLFDGMPERDVWSSNSMIIGHVVVGDLEAANELFERMLERDVVSWNCIMINSLAKSWECFYGS
ncbi:Tetratricopeptide-like helical domain superfamily [Sesbania bispinosa]|nr:Tetratricopeptide-like helical domain superfamily [Sesbania bispinosa]